MPDVYYIMGMNVVFKEGVSVLVSKVQKLKSFAFESRTLFLDPIHQEGKNYSKNPRILHFTVFFLMVYTVLCLRNHIVFAGPWKKRGNIP